ncbi:MAG TPA: 2-amino-4-hydroxy-6-hydroxymethyldihydropteridine diphosphokinase [Terriglobales bacterium]|nr:2-amino-4-hydroxy-6-hydroxymethyldihydropteridine diphosphokinase [Terriglobales bacterium]
MGSNRGDRERYLQSAMVALSAAGLRVLNISPMLETQPLATPGRRRFLNCVVAAETDLSPRLLLRRLRRIEHGHGRHGQPRANLPRTLDLDLIFYGQAHIQTPELQVPHPRFAQRPFVLTPLAAIAPGLRPPGCNRTAAQLARRLSSDRF